MIFKRQFCVFDKTIHSFRDSVPVRKEFQQLFIPIQAVQRDCFVQI